MWRSFTVALLAFLFACLPVAVGAGEMIIRDATVNMLRMIEKLRDVPER